MAWPVLPGCRYKQGHANDHWKASAHCYALELETQRVWDYAGACSACWGTCRPVPRPTCVCTSPLLRLHTLTHSVRCAPGTRPVLSCRAHTAAGLAAAAPAGDGYVHRLIQSKTDGKLVEVPSPAPTCPHGSPSVHHHRRLHHHHHHRQRSQGEPRPDPLARSRSGSSAPAPGACSSGTDADLEACTAPDCPVCADENKQMKEALVSSKLEAISLEYNHLLATQLDSQRQYFEGLLAQQDAKQQAAVAAAKAAAEQAAAASLSAAGAAKESERKRQQLERKLVSADSDAPFVHASFRHVGREADSTAPCMLLMHGAAHMLLRASDGAFNDCSPPSQSCFVVVGVLCWCASSLPAPLSPACSLS